MPYEWPPPHWAQTVDPTVDPGLDPALLAPEPLAMPPAPPMAAPAQVAPPPISFAPNVAEEPLPLPVEPEPAPAAPAAVETPAVAPLEQSFGDSELLTPSFATESAPREGTVPMELRARSLRESTPDEEAQDLLALGPEEYAAKRAQFELDREAQVNARRQEMLEADQERQQRNLDTAARARSEARQRTLELSAEAKRIADTEIDPDRWMDSRDSGQKVAAYVTAIIGGILSPYRGGRNDGLEMIMGQINQDIDAQKANLANRTQQLGTQRGLVAELYAQGMDEFEAAETARQAMWHQVDARLAMEKAKYDPRSSSAFVIAEAQKNALSIVAESRAKSEEQSFEKSLKLREAQRADDKLALDRQQASRAAADSRAAREATVQENAVLPAEYFGAVYGEAPPIPMSEKQFKTWLTNKGEQSQRQGREAELAQKGRARDTGLADADGNPILAKSEAEGIKSREKKATALTIAGSIDQALAIKERNASTWNDLNSEDKQALTTILEDLKTKIAVAGGQGAISEGDAERYKKMLGDPNSVWSNKTKLSTIRTIFVDDVNNHVAAVSEGKAERWEPPRLNVTKPKDEVGRDFDTAYVPGLGSAGVVDYKERVTLLDELTKKVHEYKKPGVNSTMEELAVLGQKEQAEKKAIRNEEAELQKLSALPVGDLMPADARRREELEALIPERKKILVDIGGRIAAKSELEE